MTVATRVQPDSTTQTGPAYKAAIDSAAKVDARLAAAFAPCEQSTPNMTIALDAGHVFNGVASTEVAAQSTGSITAPVGNPRIDRIVVSRSTGAVSVVTGTPAASPAAPSISAGYCPVAQVLLQTTSAAITNSMITDERDLSRMGFVLGSGMTESGGTISPDINGLTSDSSPDLAADYAMTWDASASALKKVLLSNIGGVSAVEFSALQQAVIQNYLLDSINGAWAAGSYSNGGYDAFNSDTIGANSTSQTYDGTNKLYSNPGGYGSDILTGSFTYTVSETVSGGAIANVYDNNTGTYVQWGSAVSTAVKDLTVQLTSALVCNKLRFNLGTTGSTYVSGEWLGSNNGSTWTSLGTNTTAFVAGTWYEVENISNSTAYSYYRLRTTLASAAGYNMQVNEIELLQNASAANMTLVSSALSPAPASTPTQVKLTVLYKAIDASTPNTDFTAEATRDGTTWTVGTLTDTGLTMAGFKVLWAVIDVSGQPSGTSVKYRLKTLNAKSQQAKGVALMVK